MRTTSRVELGELGPDPSCTEGITNATKIPATPRGRMMTAFEWLLNWGSVLCIRIAGRLGSSRSMQAHELTNGLSISEIASSSLFQHIEKLIDARLLGR